MSSRSIDAFVNFTSTETNEIKKIKSKMHILYSYVQQGMESKYLIIYYIELIEKLQTAIGDYQSFNIDMNEFDCIQRKMTEIADSNQESKDKLKDHLEKARDLRRNLHNLREKKKFYQQSQIIKNYNDLRVKKVSSILCCGHVYKTDNNMLRHINQNHPETFIGTKSKPLIEISSNQNQSSIRPFNEDHGKTYANTSIKIPSNQYQSKPPIEKDHREATTDRSIKIPTNRNQMKRRITVYVI